MKKILFALSAVFLLVCVPFVFAKQEIIDQARENRSDFNYLFVSDISTDEEQFKTGGSINGTFNLVNTSEYVISGARYRIELVQIFEDSVKSDFGDNEDEIINFDQISNAISYSSLSNAINASPGSQNINFTYQIPQILPEGRIGILIQLYTSNELPSGSDFIEIDVKGERSEFKNILASLNVNGEQHALLEGPTLSKSDKVTLKIESEDSLDRLVAELNIFSGNNTNGKLINTSKVSVNNNSIEIPSDFDPGVYTGKLSLLDSSGINRVVPIEFRYILSGLKPKIGEVSYKTTNLVENNFEVSISYLDIPLSFRKNSDGTYQDERVQKHIELNGAFNLENITSSVENFKGLPIDHLSNNISAVIRVKDFLTNSLLVTKNVNFTNSADVIVDLGRITDTDKINVEIDLYQDGELIDTHSDTINVETYKHKNIFDKIWNSYGKIVTMIIALIIILIIVALIRKSNINKKIAISSFVALFILGSSIVITEKVEAIKTSGFKVEPSYIGSIRVVSPKPPKVEVYEPGENMRFTAEFSFGYCTNSGYQLHARVSKPVLRGKPHAPMGTWKALGRKRFVGTMWDNKHVRYESGINWVFKAPNTPGIYTFKYDVVATSGDWGDYDPGVVTFKVANDVCKNIPGVQENVPRGYVAARSSNGQPICNIQPQAQLNCPPSNTRLQVGEAVTYSARTTSGNRANFSWYDGRDIIPNKLVKTENNVVSSTYQKSYDQVGVYYTTAQAATGTVSDKCTMVVAVGEDLWDDIVEEETTEEIVEEDDFYTDEDGTKYPLDKNSAPGKITFNMDERLTNTTCTGDWKAENVLKCGLYRNNSKVEDNIALIGNKNFNPGIYQIKCIQAKDGREIVSETRNCRLNPNVREL